MARTAKVAVTIEHGLLEKVEKLRRSSHESRSAVFARALRTLLREEERRREARRYVDAYVEHPERPAETGPIDRLAEEALRAVPWEDE